MALYAKSDVEYVESYTGYFRSLAIAGGDFGVNETPKDKDKPITNSYRWAVNAVIRDMNKYKSSNSIQEFELDENGFTVDGIYMNYKLHFNPDNPPVNLSNIYI